MTALSEEAAAHTSDLWRTRDRGGLGSPNY
jgi:hypothetical protein